MAYTNDYVRINWQNEPSEATALNDVNLNKMDAEIYEHGEVLESMDSDISDISSMVSSITSDISDINTELDTKVDKIDGYGLSQTTREVFSHLAQTGNVIAYYTQYYQNGSTYVQTLKNGITIDSAISDSSENPVQNKVVKGALDDKVDKVDGYNLCAFKNLTITGLTNEGTDVAKVKTYFWNGSSSETYVKNGVTVDSALSSSSENPVQNKVVKSAIDGKSTVAISDTLQTGDTIANVTIDGITTAIKAPLVEVDSAISTTSENPVQNKVIAEALRSVLPEETVNGNPISITDGSDVVPAKECSVSFSPIQDLSNGDPSPTNICPISGWTGLNLGQCNKNLIIGKIAGASNNSSGEIITSTNSDIYIARVKAGVSYCISVNGTLTSSYYGIYTSYPTIGSVSVTGRNYNNKLTPAVDGYIAFRMGNDVTQAQIELGQTASDYVTPISPATTYTANFGDTYYGGKYDFATGVLTIDKVGYTINDLSWAYSSSNAYFYTTVADMKTYASGEMCEWECECYKNIGSLSNNSAWENAETGSIGTRNNTTYVYIKDTRYNSQENLKTAMGDYKFTIKLATPTTVQLTPADIELLKGQNVLWSDANGNLKLTYSADIKAYINKIINA